MIPTSQNLSCVEDYEAYALSILPKNAADYYKSGAEHEVTLKNNKLAFRQLRIRPRVLIDVSNRSSDCSVLEHRVSFPVGISPTAMQRMAHSEGECATARAAGAIGTIFIQSTLSTSSIEEVAEAAPNTVKWFQLYIYCDRLVTMELVKRAEIAGFKAIVLTVDAPFFGTRYADKKNKFTLPSHLRLANFQGEKANKVNEKLDDASSLNKYVTSLLDQKLTWKDVKWLKSITQLPIIVKGILTAEDALIALDLKVAGIFVSNHGGRQLDTCPASIQALPEIVKVVAGRCEVYLDGGVRNGTDIFKAIALGAKMVFVGRPALWGLAHSGEEGVKNVLNILKEEFNSCLGLAGCSSVDDIKKEMVVHEHIFCNL
uniref:(S)-2-hydroxy-acid oxidase n=1 Tax=Clastoptera arizonana TaxID=38151 RepID=A0A1B6E4M7_9HEMI